ncbi:MAG: hypothetical protein EXR69_11215 [Myxococcales bacterium]|nr:hypothetical protein [Myxococcales bacterium]
MRWSAGCLVSGFLGSVGCLGADSGEPGDSGGEPAACASGTISLTDANNVAFSGTLDVPATVTASGKDVGICWEQATQDIQCHALDPAADVDTIRLVRFGNLTQDEVRRGLAENDLLQSEMTGYV